MLTTSPPRAPLARAESDASGARTISRLARGPLLVVLAAALVLRLVILGAVEHVPLHNDDERDYVTLAARLHDGHGFSYAERGPTSMRPPLFPAMLAAVWKLSGPRDLQAARALQIALSLGTVVVLFAVARRLFDDRVAIMSAAAWAVYPSFLYAGVQVLTEALFTLLLLLVVWCWTAIVQGQRGSPVIAVSLGLALGLAALTRSILWPAPLLLVPLALIVLPFAWRTRLSLAVLMMVGYVTVVAPWAVRNSTLQGTFVVVDTMGGLNLRMGNYEHTQEDRMWDGVSLVGEQAWSYAMVQEHPDARFWTDGQRERWARDRAVEYMLAHPVTTARRAVLKFADFWGLEREYIAALADGVFHVPPWFAATSAALVVLTYVAAMLLACFGWLTVPRSSVVMHLAPLFFIAWICALHTIVFGHSRYHLPLMPLVLTYAAAAVRDRAWRRHAGTPWRRRTAAALALVLIAIWTQELFVRHADRVRQFLNV